MFTLSGLTDVTNYALSKMVTAPNVTEKRGNIEVHRRRKMCESMKNTE